MVTTSHIIRLRHAKHYQTVIEKNRDNSLALDEEILQVQQALQWLSLQQSSDVINNIFLDYFFCLKRYFQQRSMYKELVQYSNHALAISTHQETNVGPILIIQYEALFALGEWEKAFETIDHAINVTRNFDAELYAQAMYSLGRLQINRGDNRAALYTLHIVEKLLSNHAASNILASTKAEIAAYYLNRHELNKALKLYLEVDEIRRSIDSSSQSGHTLLMLGVVYRKKGEYSKAAKHLTELRDLGLRMKDQAMIATALHHLAWIYIEEKNIEGAIEISLQACNLYNEISDIRGMADAYEQIGVINLLQREFAYAEENFVKSLEIRRRIRNKQGIASTLLRMSTLYFHQQHYSKAVYFLLQTLYMYWKIGGLNFYRLAQIGKVLLSSK